MRPLSPSLHRLSVLALGALVAAVIGTGAAPALASSGPQYGSIGQYGEVWRGGGFDATAYDNGHYDKPLSPGKFIDPVGFAVDSTRGENGTALYVLDRTSNLPAKVSSGVTSWRLQKLDHRGNVLGTSEFSLPASPDPNNYEMLGLTVDPTSGRVYALVVAYDQNPSGGGSGNAVEYVDEILAWSTTPNASQQLVAPTGIQADQLSHGLGPYLAPGVLSTASQLVPGGTPNELIQNPQGLALDVTGGADYLAVQGGDPTGITPFTGIAQVSTASGAITKQWSSSVLSGLPNDNGDSFLPPAGISTAADHSLTVLLNEQSGGPAGIDVVDVPANLSSTPKPKILASLANAPLLPSTNLASDDAAIFTSGVGPESSDSDGTRAATLLAAPQVVALSNGLYAAEFEPDPVNAPDLFNPAALQGDWTLANPALRLLRPLSDGTLSSSQTPFLTSLFDTLGNPTINPTGVSQPVSSQPASACNLSDPVTASLPFLPVGTGAGASLAAGANGTAWVLTRGNDSSGGPAPFFEGGRELIELAPGGAGYSCPVPSGTFTVATQGGPPQQASTVTPLPVRYGGMVNFDASTINNVGAATAAYEWSFGDGHSTTTLSNMNDDTWPAPTAREQYTIKPGDYTVTLKMFGDFGEYDQSGTIRVVASTPPSATFSFGPNGQQAGAPVSFDASGSTPSPGASIIDYHWDWGDGTFDETPMATDSHAYAAPGTYTVSLTVLDSQYGRSAPVSKTVTVVAPPFVPVPTTPLTANPLPTTPTPTKPSPSRPTLTAAISSTASRRGLVRVTVFCHPGPVSCDGTVQLKTRTAVASGAAKKKHKGSAVLVLGRATFHIRAGKSKTFYIHLSHKARALLRRSHRVPVTSTITIRSSAGGTPIVTAQDRTLRLAAKKKPTKHHK